MVISRKTTYVDYKSVGLVASGCILSDSSDDLTSFINPEWSHTSIDRITNETTNSTVSVTTVDDRKSFTFKQFAFMNSRFCLFKLGLIG